MLREEERKRERKKVRKKGAGGAGNTLDTLFFDFRPKVHTNVSKAGISGYEVCLQ